jgi:hypothetical protein
MLTILALVLLIWLLLHSLRSRHQQHRLAKYSRRFSRIGTRKLRVARVDLDGVPFNRTEVMLWQVPVVTTHDGDSNECREVDGGYGCNWSVAKHGGFIAQCHTRFVCDGPVIMEQGFADMRGHHRNDRAVFIDPLITTSNNSLGDITPHPTSNDSLIDNAPAIPVDIPATPFNTTPTTVDSASNAGRLPDRWDNMATAVLTFLTNDRAKAEPTDLAPVAPHQLPSTTRSHADAKGTPVTAVSERFATATWRS